VADQQLLSPAERELLCEFAIRQKPRMISAGASAADQLRQRYPDIGDEEMTAVVMQIAGWAIRTGLRCCCTHTRAFGDLLGAVAVDLAHLEIDTADPS
jgi:hypothetical protein